MSQFPLPFEADPLAAASQTESNLGLAPLNRQQERVNPSLADTALTPIERRLAHHLHTGATRREPVPVRLPLPPTPSPQSSDGQLTDPLLGSMSTLVQPPPQQTPRFATPAMIEWQAVLTPAIDLALTQLQAFAASSAFAETLRLSFGEEVNVRRARPLIDRLSLIGHPTNPLGRIQVISDPPLDISGAYAPDTQTIYLTAGFLTSNATDPNAVAAALLEEIGHHIDATLNRTDRPGDEGELFAALVQGRSIDAAELVRLQTEDDTATLLLNGQAVLVEQSTGLTLIGNDSANTLNGQGGHDRIEGRGGNDELIGWGGDDRVFGGTGDDILRGGVGNDELWGEAGNDELWGGDGIDRFFGGTGDDTYVVDHTSEIITENANEGIDAVRADAHYALSTNLEFLRLTGEANWSGTGNAAANTIHGNLGSNVINGGAGNDELWGEAGNDELWGGTGDDFLAGNEGIDRFFGGAGDDSYALDHASEVITENANEGFDAVRVEAHYTLSANVELLRLGGEANWNGTGNATDNWIYGNVGNNVLSGGAGNDTLESGSGNDTLYGQTGDDWLDGGAGADLMYGGDGNDWFRINDFDDRLFDTSGIDAAESSVTYRLPDGIEDLYLTGAAFAGAGNALNNWISGNDVNNRLTGEAGDDVLGGWFGDDELQGAAGNDTLYGDAGNDWLDGGAGADLMEGGDGNDTFVVDSLNDSVSETSGIDSVRSSVSHTLAVGIEHLTLLGGTATLNGAGNTLNNSLTGNAGNNTLSGASGNDVLDGGEGNDVLDGGSGNDTLIGGNGDDTYLVEAIADVVAESSATGGSADAVRSTISYTLGANLESLELTATAERGVGNALSNTITGNAIGNTLLGGGGNDVLQGSSGLAATEIDVLTGGAGADRFVLGTTTTLFYDDANAGTAGTSNYALITDFDPTQGDVIALQGATISGSTTLSIQGVNATAYRLLPAPSGLPQGIAVYLDKPGSEPDELLGIIQAATGVSLTIASQVAAPTLLILSPGSDTGTSSTDRITQIATPTIQGQAPLGTIVTLRQGTVVVGQGSVDAQGRWSITTNPLANGTQTLTATATDAAGNVSVASSPLTLVVDSTRPTLNVTPLSSTTLSATSRLIGTASDSGSALATVSYRFNNNAPIALTLNAGSFNQAIDLTGLSTGAHTLSVSAIDVAGNTTTTNLTVSVNTPILPNTTIISPTLQANLAQDTGAISSDGITTNPTVTGRVLLTGTGVELAATLSNPTLNQWSAVTLNADRTFTLDLARLVSLNGGTLPDGDYTLSLRVKDAQGVWSTPQPLQFRLDRTAPQVQVSSLVDGVAWLPGRERIIGTTETGAQVQYRVNGQVSGSISATDGAFNQVLNSLPTQVGAYTLEVSSRDLAGNEQAVRYNFLIKDTALVKDDDAWAGGISTDQPLGSDTGGGTSWGFVGPGGTWGWSSGGRWTAGGGGTSGGGTGGGNPDAIPTPPPDLNLCNQVYRWREDSYLTTDENGNLVWRDSSYLTTNEIGNPVLDADGRIITRTTWHESEFYALPYQDEIRDILTYAADAISTDSLTIAKKAALTNRIGRLTSIAGWLMHEAEDLTNQQDAILSNWMQPVFDGIYDKAYDGITTVCRAAEVGYALAQNIVLNPSAVRVRTFEAALFAVVGRVFAERGIAIENNPALVTALQQLSETYVKLNPQLQGSISTNFLNPLWRLNFLNSSVGPALDESLSTLRQSLQGVNDPVKALQFINNLIQAVTEVVSLNQGEVKAVRDAQFLQELVAFGFEYAKLNAIDLQSANTNGAEAFLATLWPDTTAATETAKQQATGKVADLFKALDTNEERVKMVEFGGNLLKATKLLPPELQPQNNSKLVNSLISLGGAYAALEPIEPTSSGAPLNLFLDTLWRSSGDSNLLVGSQQLADFLKDSRAPHKLISFTQHLLEANGSTEFQDTNRRDPAFVKKLLDFAKAYSGIDPIGLFADPSGFLDPKQLDLNQVLNPSPEQARTMLRTTEIAGFVTGFANDLLQYALNSADTAPWGFRPGRTERVRIAPPLVFQSNSSFAQAIISSPQFGEVVEQRTLPLVRGIARALSIGSSTVGETSEQNIFLNYRDGRENLGTPRLSVALGAANLRSFYARVEITRTSSTSASFTTNSIGLVQDLYDFNNPSDNAVRGGDPFAMLSRLAFIAQRGGTLATFDFSINLSAVQRGTVDL